MTTVLPVPPGLVSESVREEIAFLRSLPAAQQPDWGDHHGVAQAVEELAQMPPLVTWDEVDALRGLLAEAAAGRLQIVQAGDCAEDPAECDLSHISRKVALLDLLAGAMRLRARKPVLRVGRIAGQFAKPRSLPTETVDGTELPVYRGHMVNGPEPVADQRRPDPRRLLSGYRAARTAHDILRHRSAVGALTVEAPVWTSHEALLLDYELPMLRQDRHRGLYLASTHWPWIGDRTRQPDGAHVAMLGLVANPVACKVGPSMSAEDLLSVCQALDPAKEPGRLTLIARMGAEQTAAVLPPLVEAVREAGHRVLWMCDPMHGNTVRAPGGAKTRRLDMLSAEVEAFQQAVGRGGGIAVGLHLETTPDPVLECVADAQQLSCAALSSTSLCDPRLNPEQALTLASQWRGTA